MHLLEEKKKKLLDLRLENLLKADDFDLKYSEISAKIEMHEARLGELHEAEERRSLIKERVVEFRKLLQNNEIIVKFDRTIFESVVENVIIGGVDENGEKDPYQISFVYKMGMTDMANVKKNRVPRKVRVNRETGEQEFVCTSASGEFGALCCDSTPDARRECRLSHTKGECMNYQLHDSQINKIELGEDTITLKFLQGFWATDEHGKMCEQLENCKIVFEIDRDDVPIEDFISVRISKKGGIYKTISLKKFMGLLKKSPFNVYLEYNCDFASRKMFQMHSNYLKIGAEVFIEDIKNIRYIHD